MSGTTVLVAFLIAIGPVAISITKAVDLVRDFIGSTWRDKPWLWNALAFVLGVGYCLLFQYSAMALIPGINQRIFAGWVGQVATGLAVGATADFWHKHLAAKSSGTPVPRG